MRTLPLALALCVVSQPCMAKPSRLTARQAVERALAHNLDLKHARLAPELSNADEQAAEAQFDPVLSSGVDVSGSPGQISQQRAGLSPVSSVNLGGDLGIRKSFSTGTSLEAKLSSLGLFGRGGASGGLDPAYQSSLHLTARQSLLTGISRSANEIAITRARMTREMAKRNLARGSELIAAVTLKAYWDLHAALAKHAIQRVALQIGEKTLAETNILIASGKHPASERVSADYTVQTHRRDLLYLANEVGNARDVLARLTGLVPANSTATPAIVTVVGPRPQTKEITRGELQRIALERRHDYLELTQQVELRRMQLRAARHRKLPTLDLVGGVSLTGISGTSADGKSDYPEGYWASYGMDRVGWSAGLLFELPLFNRRAKADAELAAVRLRQAEVAADIAVQTISQELNVAWRAVEVARQRLRLTKVAAKVAEVKLFNEEARYKAGKSTAHILSTVQAEVVKERLAREQALADVVKARVDLHAAAGVLIERLRTGAVRRSGG